MELTELKNKILSAFSGSSEEKEHLLALMEQDKAIFPYNEYEWFITTCVAKGHLTYEHYLDIRSEYLSRNPNLWIFEISAPRSFGEKFAQSFLLNKCSALKPASRGLDREYHGQYDLWLDSIRIEVKASRVTDSTSDEPLYRKALSIGTSRPFLMNFQQLKPQCCDVFAWMAVYRDAITTWIMSSREVLHHPAYSKGQHRGNTGNEGQLHIDQSNINTLDEYKLTDDNLEAAIRSAALRN